MDRYFIHIVDGTIVRDEDGEALPDVAAARTAALRTLGEILRSREERFWNDGHVRVFVENAAGEVVVNVETRDLLAMA